MKPKSYLILPVRGHSMEESESIVRELEEHYEVHWPPRDVDQNDSTGKRICNEHWKAMVDANIVHVIWDGKSQGCLFDLGMAFALRKDIKIISLPEYTDGKSYQNMVRDWEQNGID